MMKNDHTIYLETQIKYKLCKIFDSYRIPKEVYIKVLDKIDLSKHINSFYSNIHQNFKHKIVNDLTTDNIICRSTARNILGLGYGIPPEFHICVLNDMKDKGFIKVKNKRQLIIL